MKTPSLWTLLVMIGSNAAAAATPSLEERYQNQLCLGRWTLDESILIETSSVLTKQVQKSRIEKVQRQVPPVEIEGPRDSEEAGAYLAFVALCNDHGASIVGNNPKFNDLVLRNNASSTGKKRGKLTYKGTCWGTYVEDVTVNYLVNESDPVVVKREAELKKTQSQLGLTKDQVRSSPDLLVSSLQQKIKPKDFERYTGVEGSLVRGTQEGKNYQVNAMECSTADHIPATDLEAKANYLITEMASWEKDNYTSCTHPEFKLIAGTLWHIRLVDLSGNFLSPALRSKIDEKAQLYPACVLDGDQAPNFDSPEEIDFTITTEAPFAWLVDQRLDIGIPARDFDQPSITFKGGAVVFEYEIQSSRRRSNYSFVFKADGSFTEQVRANFYEYAPGTEAHAQRVKDLIAEIDSFLAKMAEVDRSEGTAALQAFQAHLQTL